MARPVTTNRGTIRHAVGQMRLTAEGGAGQLVVGGTNEEIGDGGRPLVTQRSPRSVMGTDRAKPS